MVAAAGGGAAAYVLGYVFTYVLSGSTVRESAVNQLAEFLSGQDITAQLVGWVFYNAHGVTTTLEGPFGSDASNLIAQSDALSPLLYVIPPALLLGAGLLAAGVAGTADLGDALKMGPAVTVGYLSLAVVGVFLFTVSSDI